VLKLTIVILTGLMSSVAFHILGPLLYIFYINELPYICDSGSQLFLYADDAKIYNNILNRQDKDTLQNDLIKLKSWADNWLI